jgi:hypothetical protein
MHGEFNMREGRGRKDALGLGRPIRRGQLERWNCHRLAHRRAVLEFSEYFQITRVFRAFGLHYQTYVILETLSYRSHQSNHTVNLITNK